MKINLVGLDPSLSNLGIALVSYDDMTQAIAINDLRIVKTESTSAKTVRRNSDDLERAKMLRDGMVEACRDATIAIAEVPVGSQSARAMASYGICVGVLAGCPLPLIQVNPTEVKLAATGIKTATKDEMIAWAVKKFPDAPWQRYRQNGKKYKKGDIADSNEHIADALAAIVAGVKTDQFKQALALARSLQNFK